MQRHCLEWLYRICREPRRLWRRYLFLLPKFLLRLAVARMAAQRRPQSASLNVSGERRADF
jgi:UDP-N-acetyl-D-mannosaminuronic acid transferase (WecB/TagA/CpsF family)